MTATRRRLCSYCGSNVATDSEHVFPKSLYPESRQGSRIQRLTVPACNGCNNGWADDEAHFRNVLALAGEPNPSRQELWETKIVRAFRDQLDGHRRISDLLRIVKPASVDGEDRHMVYPAEDPRVLRVVKKIVRGLSHHHRIESALSESRVWVDIMKYRVPEEFLPEFEYAHREQDIVEYRFTVPGSHGIASAWLVTFFQRVTFVAIVWEVGGIPIEAT